jgi:hypothetical protein
VFFFFAETGLERSTDRVEAKFQSCEDELYMFEASFNLPASFGTVGAVRLDNDNEMFVKDVKVFPEGDESSAVMFHCESWVIENEKTVADDSRVFFSTKVISYNTTLLLTN